jgi:molecular chaperone GrpE
VSQTNHPTDQQDEAVNPSPASDGASSDESGPTDEVAVNGTNVDPESDPDPDVDSGADGDPASGTTGATDAGATNAVAEGGQELSVEALVADLERVTVERDQYLEASRRIQAEFENYRKQVSKRELEARERANETLVGEMLPVLDAFDAAVSSGVEAVEPMRVTLLDALSKQGLERIDPSEAPFDPNLHEAVMHEDGEGEAGPVVAEVMRAGYLWKGRVVRPAMVRVRG